MEQPKNGRFSGCKIDPTSDLSDDRCEFLYSLAEAEWGVDDAKHQESEEEGEESKPVDDAYAKRRAIRNEKNKLLRYIIYLYDPASHLGKEYPDELKLKEAAADLAGLDLVNEDFKWLFDCQDEGVNAMAVGYLRYYVKSMLWMMIVSNQETFWEYGSIMMESIRGKTGEVMNAVNAKMKTSEGMEVLMNRVEKYKVDFFHPDSKIRGAVGEDIYSSEKMAGVLSNKRG